MGNDLCLRVSSFPVFSLTTCAWDVRLGGAGSFRIGLRPAEVRPVRSPDFAFSLLLLLMELLLVVLLL